LNNLIITDQRIKGLGSASRTGHSKVSFLRFKTSTSRKPEGRSKLSQTRALKEVLHLSRNPLREDVVALEPKGLIAIKVKNDLQEHEKRYYDEVMEQGKEYKPVGIRGATA